ncbi:MAG: inositol monophosphatase family protein [Planctomycetota bacterium]
MPVRDRLDFAVRVASAAAAATLHRFAPGHPTAARVRDLDVEAKADGSEVTAADREAEQFMRNEIQRAFPGDGILGEEFEETPSDTGRRWIIDPIDGTYSFVRGVPLYTTLLACERLDADGSQSSEGVDLGVIVAPALGETVYAQRGSGAWFQPSGATQTPPVRAVVSNVSSPASASLSYTSLDYFRSERDRAVVRKAIEAAATTRGWPDAYAAMLVATGRCDALIEPTLKPWDAAPMQPIILEAGGMLTDWQGNPTIRGEGILATNGKLHGALLAAIANA